MLLMVVKCIRGGMCHVTHRYAKTNNKSKKDYDKNKYWYVNNLYGWAMPQKLLTAHLQNKSEYAIQIRNLKQTCSHGLVFKKSIVINFNAGGCLKPSIDMNTELRKKQKTTLKKTF